MGYTQRELVYLLRYYIDIAATNPPVRRQKAPTRQKGERGILRLVDEGAHIGTKHVLWNIGQVRRTWLIEFLHERRPDWRPKDG